MNRRQMCVLASALLAAVACASACGGGGKPAASRDELPPMGLEEIRRGINNDWVKVPAADGKTKPIDWVFQRNEPKEIEIVEQKFEGETATFLINMKTRTRPNSPQPRSLSGQLRLHYRLQTGIVLREWELEGIENISFTYTNEPPPSPTAETKKGGDDEDEDEPGADAKPDANAANSNSKPNANTNSKPGAKNSNRNSPV